LTRSAREFAGVVFDRYTAALAYQDYRTLWIANLCSGAAAWALIVARGALVYNEFESSTWVAVVTFAAMIPRVFIPPIAGYLSDKFDRRRVVSLMYAINLAQTLGLSIYVLLGDIDPWVIVGMSLINGSARAAQMPASQSLVPNLVPRRLLLNGIALNQATMQGSRLFGPIAIVPMLATMGVSGAFFLCTAFYVVSLLQSLRISTVSTGTVRQGSNFIVNFANSVWDGIRYVYRTPILRVVVFMALFHCGLTMSFESLLPVLSDTRLNARDAGFTLLMAAVGGGALVSVIAIAGVTSNSMRGKLFMNLGVISGLAPAVLALSVNMPTALLAAAFMGATQSGFMTLTHTMIQSVTDDSVRGRVGAVYSIHIGGMMALVNLINGWMADIHISDILLSSGTPLSDLINDMLSLLPTPIGPSPLLLVGGVAFILVMFVSWQATTIRQIYRGELRYSVAAAH
jgi:MFS family permease